MLRRVAASALIAPLLLLPPTRVSADPSGELVQGDAAYARRAEGQVEGRARPEPIGEAVRAYQAALEADPDSLEAHWKLVRALYFSGDFVNADPDGVREVLDRATRASDRALEALERAGLGKLPDEPDAEGLAPAERRAAAAIHFWSAIAWGAWSQRRGLLSAVRAGVAGRMRDHAETVLVLDPRIEGGGADRLLARLHASLPRVPFLSGWVDRDRALPHAEAALAIDPTHPGNRLLLALTLLDVAPARRDEALAQLEALSAAEPRAGEVVEDLAILGSARERLAEERGEGPDAAGG